MGKRFIVAFFCFAVSFQVDASDKDKFWKNIPGCGPLMSGFAKLLPRKSKGSNPSSGAGSGEPSFNLGPEQLGVAVQLGHTAHTNQPYRPRIELKKDEFIIEDDKGKLGKFNLDPQANDNLQFQFEELLKTKKTGEKETHVYIGRARFGNIEKHFVSHYIGQFSSHLDAEIVLRVTDENEAKSLVGNGSWLDGWAYKVLDSKTFSRSNIFDPNEVVLESLPWYEGSQFLILSPPKRPRESRESGSQDFRQKEILFAKKSLSEWLVRNRDGLHIEFQTIGLIEKQITAGIDVPEADHMIEFRGNSGEIRAIDIYLEAVNEFRGLLPQVAIQKDNIPGYTFGLQWFGTISLPRLNGEVRARQVVFDILPESVNVYTRVTNMEDAAELIRLLNSSKINVLNLDHAGTAYQPLIKLPGVGPIVISIRLPMAKHAPALISRSRTIADWMILLRNAVGLSLFSVSSPGISSQR